LSVSIYDAMSNPAVAAVTLIGICWIPVAISDAIACVHSTTLNFDCREHCAATVLV